MGIDVKTTATLMDELFTTLLKCFYFQEVVMKSSDEGEVARAAKRAQETNSRRNLLITAIDERLGEGSTSALIKTYTSEEIRKRFEEVTNDSCSTSG
jgi:hypothetical protein